MLPWQPVIVLNCPDTAIAARADGSAGRQSVGFPVGYYTTFRPQNQSVTFAPGKP